MSHTIGIDLGTTTIKAARFDESGELLAMTSRPFREGDQHELPLEQVESAILDAAWELMFDKTHQLGVISFGIASQTNSFVLQYKGLFRRRTSPLYVWTGDWAGVEADRLNHHLGLDDIARHTGLSRLTGQMLAPKCLRLKEADPGRWRRIRRVMLLPDRMQRRLSGTFASDATLWSLTGLYDVESHGWWRPALEMLELTPRQLPGWKANPKRPTISLLDHLAAAVAVGNLRPGHASISLGTATCVVVTHADRPPVTADGVVGRHPVSPGLWYKLAWSNRSSQELDKHASRAGKPLEQLLADADQGTSEEAATTRAMIRELNEEAGRLLTLAAADRPIETVVATGGSARSDLRLANLAAVLGRPVARPACVESAAKGAALLAARAAGMIDTPNREPVMDRVFHPDGSRG